MLVLFGITTISAETHPDNHEDQTQMTCRSSIQLSLNQFGFAVITPQMLLATPQSDYSNFIVTITNPAQSSDTVFCDMVGIAIEVMVTDTSTIPSNSCWSTVTVEDKLAPVIICDTAYVSCNIDPFDIPSSVTYTDAYDNCTATADLVINYNETFTPLGCSALNPYTFRVLRTYVVTDEAGFSNSCQQVILWEKPSIIAIDIPADITLSCPAVNTDPSYTGYPSLNGEPIDDLCMFAAAFDDDETGKCGNSGIIKREWTIMDMCTGDMRVEVQNIMIKDSIAPTIYCPSNTTVSVNSMGCTADYDIPPINVTDDCSDYADINIWYKVDGYATSAAVSNLSMGIHTITVFASDPCYNIDSCEYTVEVVDNLAPVLMCSPAVVSLDLNGQATIGYKFLSNYYIDNCGILDTAIRRLDAPCGNPADLNFGNEVSFCCQDIGQNVMIAIRVRDVNGNTALIMCTVEVIDAYGPTLQCPADMTIACTQLDDNLNFGDPIVNDNCGYGLDSIIVENIDDCGTGTIIRTFTVSSSSGVVATCDQTITVVNPMVFDQNSVTTPADVVLTQCNPDTSVNTLGDLTVTGNLCGNIWVQHSDAIADSYGACILYQRTWLVMNACDVNAQYTYVQNILVKNNSAPDINVPNDVTVNVGANCLATYDPPAVTYDTCSTNVTITNNYNNDGGDISNVTFPHGTTVVTYTATDDCGHSTNGSFTVTAIDNVPPQALCRNITVQLDASGIATIVPSEVDNGSFDDCTAISLTVNPNTFNCSNLGPNSVVLTVTDTDGNMSQCNAVVTIEDNVNPEAICQNFDVELDASGNATISVADINNGSNDNCSIASMSLNQTAFDCNDVGANTVTLTVIDGSGNTDQCTAVVTVNDNIDPNALCQIMTIQLDANGQATTTAAIIDNGSTDNCGIVNMTLSQTDFTCADLGTNNVTLTVTDASGNSDQCTTVITVEDNIDPQAVCQDITVTLSADGNATITAAQIDNGSTDNCSISSITVSPMNFNCSNVGDNVVVLTVTDGSGHIDDCTANVHVEDNIDPQAVCQNITIQLDQNGNASIVAADVDGGSNDVCSGVTLSVSPTNFDCTDIGDNNVILTVNDANGNSSNCTAVVTVEDNVDPIAVCQDITVELDANGDATITAAQIDGGSTDNCGIDNINVVPTSFDCTDIGDNIVTLTVTDVNGNSDNCQATVTVIETIPPVVVCADVTLSLGNNGTRNVSFNQVTSSSSDNCGIVSQTVSPNMMDCSNIGDNIVQVTVTDASGNSDTCMATVTIVDDIPPVASCQDITISLNANGMATIAGLDVNGSSTDNCSIATYSVSPNSFDCTNVGPNTVTLTVTDGSGNTANCTAVVTVEDNIDLIAVCQDITVELDANGQVTITAAQIDGGSSDNCALNNISVSPSVFDCADIGDNTVILTVTDVNGNSDTCQATVTVVDIIPPMVVCADVTLSLGNNGTRNVSFNQVTSSSSDNCGIVSQSVSPNMMDCSNIGDNVVQVIVYDASGNSDTCMATVTIVDDIPPVAVCQDITITLNASGTATIAGIDVNGSSTDNCSIVTYSVSPNTFDCTNAGDNTVTLTVTDGSGNTDDCTANVHIIDNGLPTAICQNITIALNANGNRNITAIQVDNGSSDNCGGPVTLTVSQTNFNCNHLGANVVTLTATDSDGNTDTCQATVTVEDNINPMITPPDDITAYSTQDSCDMYVVIPLATATDNCDVLSITNDYNNGGANASDEYDFGVTTIVWTATDQSGNQATGTSTVTIIDTIAPIITCPADTTVSCDADIFPLSQFGMATGIDNCFIVPGAGDIVFDVTDVVDIHSCNGGQIIRTHTATDGSNNVASCIQIITVTGGTTVDSADLTYPPAVVDIFDCITDIADIPLTAPFIAQISCNILNVSSAINEITPPSVGCSEYEIVWTLSDSCSTDTWTYTQQVNVFDTMAPVINAIPTPTDLFADNNCEADVTLSTLTATDCNTITITNNSPFATSSGANASGIYPGGLTTVLYTVTDVCGNISNFSVDINVLDTTPPVIACLKDEYSITDDLTVSINISSVVSSAFDNCGLVILTYDLNDLSDTIQVFDCDDLTGITVMVWVYAIDGSGNVDSCQSTYGINDVNGFCPPTATVDIGGQVTNSSMIPLNNVMVSIAADGNTEEHMNDQFGEYMFPDMTGSQPYKLEAEKSGHVLDGVTAYDLSVLMQHISGVKPFTDPYQYFAADINGDLKVDVRDMLEMRKLLLGISEELPNNNIWNFYDAHFDLTNQPNPLNALVPGFVMADHDGHSMYDMDFIGVKTGDLDNSYVGRITKPTGPQIRLELPTKSDDQGETQNRIPVYLGDHNVKSGQFEIQLDGALDLIAAIPNTATGFESSNLNVLTENNSVRVVWSKDILIDEKTPLFWLEVTAGSTIELDQFEFSTSIEALTYDEDGNESLAKLIVVNETQNQIIETNYAFELMQNMPNPFTGNTEIPFVLPEDATYEIAVYDVDGRRIWGSTLKGHKGKNVVQINESDLGSNTGILLYRLSTAEFSAVRKMNRINN